MSDLPEPSGPYKRLIEDGFITRQTYLTADVNYLNHLYKQVYGEDPVEWMLRRAADG